MLLLIYSQLCVYGQFAKNIYKIHCAKFKIYKKLIVYIWLLVVFVLWIMTGTVITVPADFMTNVSSIVNGLVTTITNWLPQLMLVSLVVGLTLFAANYVWRKLTKSAHGRS